MLPTVFWILEGYRKLYEVRSTSPALGLHLFADMSDKRIVEQLEMPVLVQFDYSPTY